MEFSLKFVPMGTIAPSKVEKNEIWIDVGNIFNKHIYDHHFGSSNELSASSLIFQNFEEHLDEYKKFKFLNLVTHQKPDLDAITGIWLIEGILNDSDFFKSVAIKDTIQLVTENDQGWINSETPEKCWPIVFRLLLNYEYNEYSDIQRVEKGKEILNTTLNLLKKQKDFSSVAQEIITNNVKFIITNAKRDYLEDLTRAVRFQLKLPIYNSLRYKEKILNKPREEPDKNVRRALSDVVWFSEPKSSLLKELARSDRQNSMLGFGFSTIVTSETVKKNEYYRYIISTDPLSGFNLDGLGCLLEQTEQKLENDSGKIDVGREKLQNNVGRFGYNVNSPWYDGRGHNFTIIDSPNVENKELGKIIASKLKPAAVLETLWEYGDPAKFINAEDVEITLIYQVSLKENWQDEYSEPFDISENSIDLRDEINIILNNLSTYGKNCEEYFFDNNLILYRQEIWDIKDYCSLWLGKFKIRNIETTLRNVTQIVAKLKKGFQDIWSPRKVAFSNEEEPFHYVFSRVSSEDFLIEDKKSYSANISYILAQGVEDKFENLPDDDELFEAERVYSKNRKIVSVFTEKGVSTFSTDSSYSEKRPDSIIFNNTVVLIVFGLIQKYSLKELMKLFIIDSSSEKEPLKLSVDILRNKWRLVFYEQELSFEKVSDNWFEQKTYEKILELQGIKKLYKSLKNKIETIDKQVSVAKSNFYQKIVFLITIILVPLGVAAGLFSGTQMLRKFAEYNYTFLPPEIQPAGWLQFLIVSSIITFIVLIIWVLAKSEFKKQNIFKKQ